MDRKSLRVERGEQGAMRRVVKQLQWRKSVSIHTLRTCSKRASDYTHWHGMYEIAEKFYQELIPEALEIADHAKESGKTAQTKAVQDLIDGIFARLEHRWINAAKNSE